MKTYIIRLSIYIVIFNPNASAQQSCPSAGGGIDFSGKNLVDSNFTTYSENALVGANFTNAILNGAQFQNVNLTNANFSGADMMPSAKGVTNLSGATLDHTCFQKSKLDSANLQYAIFKATDFSKASLLWADFGPVMTIQPSSDLLRTKFCSTTTDIQHFPISNWYAADWSNTDLSTCFIMGLNKDNFSFRGKDISWAILQGLNFSSFDFTHSTMTGVDFTNAILNYAKMDSSIMDQVKLINAKLVHSHLDVVSFYKQANPGKNADLSGAVLTSASLHHSDFSNATMKGSFLQGATADSCTFSGTDFESGNGYNAAILSGAVLNYSNFSGAHLNSVNFSNAYIVEGQFLNTTMLNTNFSGATMPGCKFNGKGLLEGVIFAGAILQNADFSGATIQAPSNGGSGVDFSCTQLGGANFGSANVLQANFANAVMPPANDCCQTQDGPFCGTIAITQLPYGAVTFPDLKNSVICPNGDNAKCTSIHWVLPNWTSTFCNNQQKPQTLWYKPNCGGPDTAGRINFPDPALQACIFKQLSGGNPNYVITKDAAKLVRSLNCPCQTISNLEGLEYFTALEKLDLSCNKLGDASIISKITALITLNVSENVLTQLNLYGLSQLKYLDASNNGLTSVSLDANFYLNYLDLSHNALTQTFDISTQSTLNYADLSNNNLNCVGDLSSLVNASTIFLQNNSLTTIGNIAGLYKLGDGNLSTLNLSCNLPFQCNTLGLDNNEKDKLFKTNTLCGVNNLPECNK